MCGSVLQQEQKKIESVRKVSSGLKFEVFEVLFFFVCIISFIQG